LLLSNFCFAVAIAFLPLQLLWRVVPLPVFSSRTQKIVTSTLSTVEGGALAAAVEKSAFAATEPARSRRPDDQSRTRTTIPLDTLASKLTKKNGQVTS
jgi:hypothetical protein